MVIKCPQLCVLINQVAWVNMMFMFTEIPKLVFIAFVILYTLLFNNLWFFWWYDVLNIVNSQICSCIETINWKTQ